MLLNAPPREWAMRSALGSLLLVSSLVCSVCLIVVGLVHAGMGVGRAEMQRASGRN